MHKMFVLNKLIVKQTFCASDWLITEINILRCTVTKTSKPRKLVSCVYFIIVKSGISVESFLDSSSLKMGPIDCPETPVRNYLYSPRHSSEERSSHLLLGGSPKSRKPGLRFYSKFTLPSVKRNC